MRTLRKKDSIENPKKLKWNRALSKLSKESGLILGYLAFAEFCFILGFGGMHLVRLNQNYRYFQNTSLVETLRNQDYIEDTKERISKSNWWGKTVEIVGFPTITMPMAYGDKLFLAQQDAKNNPNSKQNPDRTYEESFM